MKWKLMLILLTILLMAGMCLPVFAAGVSDPAAKNAADCLHALGLFTGTGTGADGNPNYDLNRAPTRQEAVTMLVRLLGKEEEAKSGYWQTPFTDVDSWAAPYVGYAYENGLTNGTGATTFGGSQSVSATQYITFILRALGYSSKTDFAWDCAWEKSDALGITDGGYSANNNAALTRGDVAMISVSALASGMKDGGSLLDNLVAAGAVSEQTAWESGLMYTAYVRSLLAMDGERYTIKLDKDRFVRSEKILELVGEYDAYPGYAKMDDPQPLQTVLTEALGEYTVKCMDGDYSQIGVPGWNEFNVSEGLYTGALITDSRGTILGYGISEDPASDEFTVVTFKTDSRPFINASVAFAKASLNTIPEIACSMVEENGTFVFHFEGIPEKAVWMEKMASGYSSKESDQWAVERSLAAMLGWSQQARKRAFTHPVQNPFTGDPVSHEWQTVFAVFVFLDQDYNIVGYSLGQTQVK